MRKTEKLTITLTWTGESTIRTFPEPQDFIDENSGDIFGIDDSGKKTLMGKFRIFYVDADRIMNALKPLYHMLEFHSPEVAEYCRLYEPDGYDFTKDLLNAVHHDIYNNNLLILDKLDILPQYRGKGYGLNILQHMIERFGCAASVAAIKPFPASADNSEWRKMMGLETHEADETTAKKKLSDHFKKLGFVPLADTPLMVMSMDWPMRNH